jgi:hypothetical protein
MSIRQVGISKYFFGPHPALGCPTSGRLSALRQHLSLPRERMKTTLVLTADGRAASRVGEGRQ